MAATPFITLEELVDRHESDKLIDSGLDSLRPVAIDNFGDVRVEREHTHETATLIRAAIIGDTNAYGHDTVRHARDLDFMWRQDLVDRLLDHEAGVTQGHEACSTGGAAVFESTVRVVDPSIRPALTDIAKQLDDFAGRLPDVPAANDVTVVGNIVTEKRLAELTGYSVSRLETMRRRLVVTQGVHWFKNPAGGIVWDTEAFDAWQRGEQAQAK